MYKISTPSSSPGYLKLSIRKQTLHLGGSGQLCLLNLCILLSIVVGLSDTGTSNGRVGSSSNDVLDAHDVLAGAEPVSDDIAENIDEANERHKVGDTSIDSIGDSSLNRWED